MKENVDNDQEIKNKNTDITEISTIIFKEIEENNQNQENDINDIKRAESRFSTTISNVSSINPLRDVHNENKFSHKSFKKKAIMESIVNLKIQYILYKIRDFIRKYQIETNTNFSPTVHKILRFLRNITLFIYGIIMFFERPWFCYEKATIPLPDYFNFTKYNESETAFFGIPFINNYALRGIEIFLTLILMVTQIIKIRNEYFLKNTKITNHTSYIKMQIVLFIFLIICLGDLIGGVCTNKFPILNFILRAFLYICMIRRIRRNIIRIGKVLWRTKTVFLLLFLNIILFAFIGFFLFQRSSYFKDVIQAILQLYILLSTCNFPDIMLSTFQVSKLGVLFFVIYVFINYFIILSYLKTSYYTKYYQINKEDCLNIIRDIIQNDHNKEIFNIKKFEKFLSKQKKLYYLDNHEYNNLLIVLGLYNKYDQVFEEVNKMIEPNSEKNMIKDSIYAQYLFKNICIEILINIICIFFLVIINFIEDIICIIFEFVWSLVILIELYLMIKYIGIRNTVFHHFNRVMFQIFNFGVIICIIILFAIGDKKEGNNHYKYSMYALKIFLAFREIRIFVFLDKFQVIKNIYKIVRISKEMFYRNLFTLYSLFLLFSTCSILLTGGTIKKGAFEKIEDKSIPKNYEYLNFNDFPSSFVTCFSLLMINNLNIIVRSLTYYVQLNRVSMEFYFATFYFFSTLIIVNIMQTLLLELYLISDFSTPENKNKNNPINEINEVSEGSKKSV